MTFRGFSQKHPSECESAGQAPGQHILYENEQSLDLRNIRKLSSERFNQGVFDGELVMGGLPQFLDRLDVSMISIGTAGEGDCLADSCRDNLANELAHIILIARSHSCPEG
jgi:hypothetical protein